jgi:hypothetical protein
MLRFFLSLIVVFFLTCPAYATPFFNVLDTTYHIYGEIGYWVDGEQFFKQYDITSHDPIEAMVEYEVYPSGPIQKVSSIAKPGFLYSEVLDTNWSSGHPSNTEAWSEIVFQPLFNGSGPLLTFYNTVDYPYNMDISVTDNTLGVDIFKPSDISGDYQPNPNLHAFDYNSWNLDHIYTIRMQLGGGANAEGHHVYEMGTNFPIYAAVPEPGMLSFLGLGLIALAGFQLRNKAKSKKLVCNS